MGSRHSRARVLSTCTYGVARPKRSSVAMMGRMSTQVERRPPPAVAQATSLELHSSPWPTR